MTVPNETAEPPKWLVQVPELCTGTIHDTAGRPHAFYYFRPRTVAFSSQKEALALFDDAMKCFDRTGQHRLIAMWGKP